jgi:protein AATF/BFR2
MEVEEEEEEDEEEDGDEDQDDASSDDVEEVEGEREWDKDVPSDSEEDEHEENEASKEGRAAALSGEQKAEDEPMQSDLFTAVLQKTREEDLRKGQALVRQLVSSYPHYPPLTDE